MRPALLIPLLALGVPACIDYEVTREQEHQSWTQPSRDAGVDILWVVDDSQSMAEEQAQLADHAAAFVGFLSVVAVDWRLGVVTTDPDFGGEMVGELLDPLTPDLEQAFSDQVVTGAQGSRDEHGFDAAVAGADPSGVNVGVWRSDADLEIVFFSDEDDHSSMAVDELVEALDALRPDATVVLSAIVGDPPEGCASAVAAADPGDRYVDAQDRTGGRRESICSADYDALLERVAFHVLGMNNTFQLALVPAVSTMEVRVDGALVHQRDRHGWRYEGGSNSVVFDGLAIPRPGSSITVDYYEWLGGLTTDTGA